MLGIIRHVSLGNGSQPRVYLAKALCLHPWLSHVRNTDAGMAEHEATSRGSFHLGKPPKIARVRKNMLTLEVRPPVSQTTFY